jgi:hypothetical protein
MAIRIDNVNTLRGSKPNPRILLKRVFTHVHRHRCASLFICSLLVREKLSICKKDDS